MEKSTADPHAVIVMPTIREKSCYEWLVHWKDELVSSTIIIVEDNAKKTLTLPKSPHIVHYSWQEIDRELGDKSWIIPRRTDCIRSFGFYKAFQMKPDMVVTLDDDCFPDQKNFLELHWEALQRTHPLGWFQHFPGIRVRGLPYGLERVPTVLNMGLWSHIPDLDAKTQLFHMDYRAETIAVHFPAPHGHFIPLSGMNLAFRPEIIPAFYFLLMGRGYEYDRFGDIWAGIFLKKICDRLGKTISGGVPYIRHERASDPYTNLEKERSGLKTNEILWHDIKKISLAGKNFKECYISLAKQLPEYSPYWTGLKEAMLTWASLFP